MSAGLLGVVTMMLAPVLSQPVLAAVGINKTVNFQGKVVNSNGTNVANGSYTFSFKLYTVASAGAAIWTETKALTVTDGVFQTNLGDVTALPGSVNFNTDSIFLGVTFNNDAAGEMTPRIQFTAAAYAFNSDALQGLGAAAFGQLNPGSAQTGSLNVTGSMQAGTGLQAPLVDTATAVALSIGTGTASSVTIGRTTTPMLIQGNSASTFTATSGANTTTVGFTAPTAARAINFPDAGGTLCTTTASTCSATYQAAGSYLAKNAADTSSFAVTAANFLYGFTNSSAAVASGVLKLDNGNNTGSALSVTAAGNPAAGQALILANNTNATPGGNLIDLQVGGVSKFNVAAGGNVGIGNANPSAKLHVTGGTLINAAGGVTPVANSPLEVDVSASSVITIGESGAGNANPAITLYRTAAGTRTGTGSRIYNPDVSGSLQFQTGTYNTAYGSETYTTNMTIQGNGAVGVGTVAPQQALTLGQNRNFAVEMAAPGTLTMSTAATGGTLAAGTYYYKVTASDGLGETVASPENSQVTTGTTSTVTISWTPITGATLYRIYRGTTAGAENVYYSSTGATFTDTGAAGTAATPPTATSAYVNKLTAAGSSYWLGGNVGIGNSAPQQALDVTGALRATTGVYTGATGAGTQRLDASGNLTNIGTYTGTGQLAITNNVNTPSILVQGNQAGWGSGIQFNNQTPTTGRNYGIYSGSDGSMHFGDNTAGFDRILISSTGNITEGGTINGQTISSAANFTGTVTSATGISVTAGGITVGGNSSITGTLGVSSSLTVSAGGASISGGINNNAGGMTGAGAVSGLSSLQYNTNGTLDTSAANSITIGGTNASSLAIGRAGITNTLYGTTQVGASSGTGYLLNNGATTNTEKNVTDRNGVSGLSIGSAATTVDIYTYISVTQTTAGQTITIPNPTASTVYGKMLYLSNVGTASFIMLGATINPGATATLIWANTNGAASWQFAGTDAGSLQTAYNNSAATDPQIQLSAAGGGLKIRDASSTVGNLLQITDSTGTAPAYLAVTSAASTITGNLLFTKETARTIQVNDSTTVGAAGAALTVKAAAGNTSGVGGNLSLLGGAGGNAAAGGSASLLGGSAGGGNSAGGSVTVGGGTATGTGTGGTVTIQGGAAAAVAGSAGGSLSVVAANGSSTAAGGNGGSISITAGNGLGTAGNGGSITLTSGSSTSGTAGGINLTSPVITVGTAGASIFKNNGATYTNACVYTGVTGAVTLNSANKTPDVCTTFMLTTSGAAAVTVPNPAAGAGSIVYVSVSSASTNAITLLGANVGIGSTATLIYNGTVWTFAGADASGLQTAYNNTSTSPASIITTSAAKNLLFQAGAGFDNSALLQVSNSVGANMISVDTTNTATSLNLMPNSGAETTSGFATTYPTTGFGTVGTTEQQTTAAGTFAAGAAAVAVTATAATSGIRANLGAALATSTIYNVSFSIKSGSAWTNDIDVRYNRTGITSDGAAATCSTASPTAGSTFSTRTISTSAFMKVSCYFTTSVTAGDATANIVIFQTALATRTFYVDNIAVIAQNTAGTQDVGDLMVGGANGQGLTLLTLDSYANTPWTGTANTSLLGSMYYDTSVGLIKCYQASGWGTCGAAPNNNVFMIPEYGNAVLNGSGTNNTGTMTANLCSGTSRLSINTGTCGATDDYNYYQWTSSQVTAQTYDIYVRYQLPPTFNTFLANNTIKAVARTSSTTDGVVNFSLYQANGTQCGTTTDLTTSGGANTWTQSPLGGNQLSCSFAAGDIMTFKINMSSKNNALVYASNISFTMTGK